MPIFTATRTWVERTEHGEQRVRVTIKGNFPSQAQADAEVDARLRREVGFDEPADEDEFTRDLRQIMRDVTGWNGWYTARYGEEATAALFRAVDRLVTIEDPLQAGTTTTATVIPATAAKQGDDHDDD